MKRWMTLWLVLAAALPVGAQFGASSADKVQVEARWSHDQAGPGDRRVLAVILDVPSPYHVNPDKDQLPPATDFRPIDTRLRVVDAPASVEIGKVQYPKPHEVKVDFGGGPMTVLALDGRNVLYLPVRVTEDAPTGPVTLNLALRVQACDEHVCYRPGTKKFTAVLHVGGQSVAADGLDGALFAGFTPAAPPPPSRVEAPIDLPDDGALVFNEFGWRLSVDSTGVMGMIAVLLLAAAGGFLLNLTPCVLPVIPLKIMGLSRAAEHRGRCFALGAVMSVGVVAFWIALAAVIIGISEFTTTSQLFRYPAFSIGVGLVIAVMAVGMCGLFAVRLPQFVYKLNPGHDTMAGSFGFGVMTAVLSTPCTAPLMGGASAWATTQSTGVTLAVFAAIGAGMALPYLVLSAFPRWVDKMPRTGPASELIKQVMGLLMLAAAAFFIGIGVVTLFKPTDASASSAYWWPVVGLCAAAGAWLAWRTVQITSRPVARCIFVILGVLMIATSLFGGVRLTEKSEINWVYYTPDRFEQARRGGNVIVLEFTAEWCLNCKAIEKAVLNRRPVVKALSQNNVVPMKVDLTDDADTASRLKLAQVGMLAPPVLVVYARDGSELLKAHSYSIEQVVDAVQRGLSTHVAAQ